MASKFSELVVDCADPELLAEFWSAVLDYKVTEKDDDEILIEGPEGSGPGLLFSRGTGSKQEKNRIHIDVSPSDRGQEEEVQRILQLGATTIDIGQGEQSWVVMADPEGNEFCVLRTRKP